MKKLIALLSLGLLTTPAWGQADLRVEAHCEVMRVDTVNESIARTKSEEHLSYSSIAPGTTRARSYLESPLMPSYMIEFTIVSGGRSDQMTVRTLRKADRAVMSTFRSAGLYTNTSTLTSSSRYTAEAKNIFLSGDDRYILDITCWQNIARH